VDFSAVWCGPCQMIGPYFGKLSEEYDGKLIFLKVDVDANRVSGARAPAAPAAGLGEGRMRASRPATDMRYSPPPAAGNLC